MTLREKAQLAERAARASGEMLEHHGDFRVRRKSENDFVTEMDFKSESLIREVLLGACPEDQFFGEETGGASGGHGRWVVDPIDGTVNFMRGQRMYTISIAYELEGELVVGCVYCPGTDELFLAVKGEGATLNGHPIHVSTVSDIRSAIVNMGFGHRDPAKLTATMAVFPRLLAQISDVRRTGSAAYDLCCLAAGRCDVFMELGLGLYDYAAGFVVLREAGGRLTGWYAGEDGLASGNILGSNGLLHDAVQAIMEG